MRPLFALILLILALLLAAFFLLVRPAWAGSTRCMTDEEKTLGRLHTVCSDGTRAIHTWNNTLREGRCR